MKRFILRSNTDGQVHRAYPLYALALFGKLLCAAGRATAVSIWEYTVERVDPVGAEPPAINQLYFAYNPATKRWLKSIDAGGELIRVTDNQAQACSVDYPSALVHNSALRDFWLIRITEDNLG